MAMRTSLMQEASTFQNSLVERKKIYQTKLANLLYLTRMEYATTYLLTSITTPDYVDRKLDGPTDDDYGGWTQFIYSRLWGSTIKSRTDSLISNWYHWRSPYTGFLFHPNTLSTTKDDFGSVSDG